MQGVFLGALYEPSGRSSPHYTLLSVKRGGRLRRALCAETNQRLTRPLSLRTHETKAVRYFFFFFFRRSVRRIQTFWSVDCWRAGDPDIPAGTFALVRTDLGAAQHVILSSHRRNNYIHCGGKKKSRSALSGKALLVCTRFDVALRSPFVLCSFY